MATAAASSATRRQIKAALIDLSGTVHIGDKLLEGALDACRKLIRNQICVKFLTNSTKSSRRELMAQLTKLGFDETLVTTENLVTTTQAASVFLRKHRMRPYCLIQESLKEDLGLTNDNNPTDDHDGSYDCVLVGLAPPAFCYERMNQAFRVVMAEQTKRKQQQQSDDNHKPLVVALHRGKYLRDVDDELSLGPGGFVACLQYAAGIDEKDIVTMGKPSQIFFQAAVPEGFLPEETAMIGDDIQQDVLGARQVGLGLAILVQTGKYQAGDEQQFQQVDAEDRSSLRVAKSLADAVDYILEHHVDKTP